MKPTKKKKLESKGWKVGSSVEFLNLSKEEADFVQLKLDLARFLKEKRIRKNYSQIVLAKELKSSQSRIAKMENADPTVTVDLLIRSLLSLGTTRKELSKVIGTTLTL